MAFRHGIDDAESADQSQDHDVDVEGHAIRSGRIDGGAEIADQSHDQDDDVEGHAIRSGRIDGGAGPSQAQVADDEDDTEGHLRRI